MVSSTRSYWMRAATMRIPLYNQASETLMISPLTPLDFLARTASVYPDSIAVVDAGRRFTYREFQTRVRQLAAALQALGVAPGDRVAVLAMNAAGPLEAHFGPMLI